MNGGSGVDVQIDVCHFSHCHVFSSNSSSPDKYRRFLLSELHQRVLGRILLLARGISDVARRSVAGVCVRRLIRNSSSLNMLR